MLFNLFVQFSNPFSEFRMEMIFDVIVGSSLELFGDHRPFVPNLIVEFKKFLFVFKSEFFGNN